MANPANLFYSWPEISQRDRNAILRERYAVRMIRDLLRERPALTPIFEEWIARGETSACGLLQHLQGEERP